jgi:thiamine pyrophosphokinase
MVCSLSHEQDLPGEGPANNADSSFPAHIRIAADGGANRLYDAAGKLGDASFVLNPSILAFSRSLSY